MEDYERKVFISYYWEEEIIKDQLVDALQGRGINVIDDIRALRYKDSLSEFIQRMGQALCVIVVISDKYLRDADCMHQLVEIDENKQFRDRIFPIILKDATIYDPKQTKWNRLLEIYLSPHHHA